MSIRRGFLILSLALAPAGVAAQAPVVIIPPDTSAAARVEVMKQQLSKMAEAQTSHFARHKKFAANMTPTRASTTAALVLRVTHANATGWSAVATSLADTSLHCGIYEGTAPRPNGSVTEPKTPGCWGGGAPLK